MKKLCFVLFLALPFYSIGQVHFSDSIIKAALKTKPQPYFTFHNRNTFVTTTNIKLLGIAAGLSYDNTIKFYLGLYGFGKQDKTLILNRSDFNGDSLSRYLSTNNLSLGVEYTYYNNGKLSLTIPVQIGIGSFIYEYYQHNQKVDDEAYNFAPLGFGTNAYYDFTDWVGLKGGIGYRISFGSRPTQRLTAPYYNLGVRIMPFKLIKKD